MSDRDIAPRFTVVDRKAIEGQDAIMVQTEIGTWIVRTPARAREVTCPVGWHAMTAAQAEKAERILDLRRARLAEMVDEVI